MSTTSLRELPAWKALEAHYRQVRERHLRELFSVDPNRGERLAAEGVGLYLDYSKHRLTDETIKLLVQLAEEAGLRDRIDAMFRGDKINVTEHRAVLHVALRARGAARSWSRARTSCPRSMRSSTRCRRSPNESVAASGRASPASRSATWSISASAARTSDR